MKITEKQLRQLVRESLQQTINENESDEGRLGNFFSSITKLTQQIQSLKQEVTQLKNEKKTKLQQLRSEHMSNMTSKANKFNNTAAQASARAQDAKNSRLAFNGQQNTQQYRAALEESKLDKIISESIKKVLMKG